MSAQPRACGNRGRPAGREQSRRRRERCGPRRRSPPCRTRCRCGEPEVPGQGPEHACRWGAGRGLRPSLLGSLGGMVVSVQGTRREAFWGAAASARREGMTCLAGLATTASLRRCVRFSSCGRAACGPLGGEREQRAGVRGGLNASSSGFDQLESTQPSGIRRGRSRCGGFPDHRRGVRHSHRSRG